MQDWVFAAQVTYPLFSRTCSLSSGEPFFPVETTVKYNLYVLLKNVKDSEG
jgi:hypothetical protein